MRRLFVALGFLCSVAPAAIAQPKVAITLRGPAAGVTGDQFFTAGLATWAGQLSNEMAVLKAEVGTTALPPQPKAALLKAVDDTGRVAAAFHRTTLSSFDRGRIGREFRALSTSLTNLVAGIQRSGLQSRGVAQSVARLQYARAQLDLAISPNDSDGWRLRIARLANALNDQADELRSLCTDLLGGGYDRTLDRQVRAFATACSKMESNLSAGGSGPQLLRDFNDVTRRWQSAQPAMVRASATHVRIRIQAARVDALFQQLAGAVHGVPGIGPGIGIPSLRPGIGILARGATFAVGAGEGGGPRVRVFLDTAGRNSFDFFAYDPDFRGGVRVALADLNGDGFPEIVTAPGPGMPPLVRVFDGQSLRLLTEFLAYDVKWVNGVQVAAADVTRTGKAVVVTGPDAGGGPNVRAFDLAAGVELDNFLAYDKRFAGGVRVALGDVNGDGLPDLITAPGPGMPPLVRIFDGRNRAVIREFNVYDPKWVNGVWIAAADVNRNGRADLICGADAGGGPHVRVFDAAQGRLLGELFAYPKTFTGGVRVAGVDVNGTGKIDIVCCPGPSTGLRALPVRVFDGVTRKTIGEFTPFERNFKGGAFVGAK
ncbi:MAG TPA: VCBS repeat-containing protein [Fimbriiglobus sp.]|jgi:hypothetical protein